MAIIEFSLEICRSSLLQSQMPLLNVHCMPDMFLKKPGLFMKSESHTDLWSHKQGDQLFAICLKGNKWVFQDNYFLKHASLKGGQKHRAFIRIILVLN